MDSINELNKSLKQQNEELKDFIASENDYRDALEERNQILYEKIQEAVEYIVKNMQGKNKYELLKILIGD